MFNTTLTELWLNGDDMIKQKRDKQTFFCCCCCC